MTGALDKLAALSRAFCEMSVADQVAVLGELDQATKEEIDNAAHAAMKGMKFTPQSGPQTLAYFSLADLVFFGGSAGGGKSALGVGVAMNEHHHSLIVRRNFANLDGLTQIAVSFNGGRDGYSGGTRPRLKMADGRAIQFGANQYEGDEQAYQGIPFDYKYFDEGSQLLESQIRFHLGWIRLAPGVPKTQRRRSMIGSNPPMDATGEWVIRMFRPWLDLTHPRPAKEGELRWYITDEKGTEVELDGPEPVERDGRTYRPSSRTFIRSKLENNIFLADDGEYARQLDATPEPLRSAIRDGNFMAARPDDPKQVIPLAWILLAQERWKEDGYKQFAMTAMAFDPAGGGADAAEISYRHGGWFGPPITRKGAETADGAAMAQEIWKARRGNNCPIVVDVGGGYGGSVLEYLKEFPVTRFNGSGDSTSAARDGSKLRFVNKRAEAWWRMREELNPEQEGGSPIALPPDPELRSDLAAPTFEVRPNGIQIESKDKIRERIGRSPGKGDAAVMCLSEGALAVQRQMRGRPGALPRYANMGHAEQKRRRG